MIKLCTKYVNQHNVVFVVCDKKCSPYVPYGPSYIHADKNYSSNFIFCPACGEKLVDITPEENEVF